MGSKKLKQKSDSFIVNRIFPLLLALVLGTTTLFWMFAWRTPIWLQDDLLFATRSGFPHGQTSFSALWDGLILDLFTRNSRSADFFVQLIFSSGPAIRVIMALSFLGLTIALAAFLYSVVGSTPNGQAERLLKQLVLAFAAVLPFTFAFFDNTAFATYLFMSATVGYILGFAWFLAVLWLLRNLLTPRDNSHKVWQLLLVFVLSLLVAFHHEVLALLQVASVLVLLIYVFTQRKHGEIQVQLTYWLTLAWVVVVSVLRFFTTGMWNRTEVYGWAFLSPDMGFFQENFSRLNYFLIYFLSHNKTMLVLLVLSFTFFYHQFVKAGLLPRFVQYLNLLSAVAMVGAAYLARRLAPVLFSHPLELEQYQQLLFSKSGMLMGTATLVALSIQIGILVLVLARVGNLALPLNFALALTGFLVPVKLTFLSGRPLFYGLFFLLLSVVSAVLSGWLQGQKQRDQQFLHHGSLLLLSGILFSLAAVQAYVVAPKIAANQKAWLEIAQQVENCSANTEITLPSRLPFREVHSPFGDEGHHYAEYLKDYFAAPDTCEIAYK